MAAAAPSPVPGVTLRTARVNGITVRYADTASSLTDTSRPLALLLHGWPESWYSWRHQLTALAAGGWRAVAPDMRGYGGTSRPRCWEEYNVFTAAGDALALVQHVGYARCALIGHDNGAALGWRLALMHPDVFRVWVPMSVPYDGAGSYRVVPRALRQFGDPADRAGSPRFMYILHHQLPDAHKDYELNTREALYRIYAFNGRTMRRDEYDAAEVTDPKLYCGKGGEAVGMWRRTPRPKALPKWLTQADLDYYVAEFERTGWDGGINWYKAMYSARDDALVGHLASRRVSQPVLFLAGATDMVINMFGGEKAVRAAFARQCDNASVVIIPRVGHWVQQEAAAEVNAHMLRFLDAHRGDVAGPASPPQATEARL